MNFKQYKDKLLQVLNIYLWSYVIVAVIYTTITLVGYVQGKQIAVIKSSQAMVSPLGN